MVSITCTETSIAVYFLDFYVISAVFLVEGQVRQESLYYSQSLLAESV